MRTAQPKKKAPQPRPQPAQLLKLFIQLLPTRTLRRLPALQALTFYDRLFTPLVSLWLLLFQRLHADHSLDAAVTHARAGGADHVHPRLASRLRSDATAAYSDARQRLPEPWVQQVLQTLGDKISRWDPAALWRGWRPVLLDGSTVRLRPAGDLPQHFPPQGNQHGPGYWCLLRVVVGFCTFSGAALDCALGACQVSEQALGVELILRATARCLFIGDRNFGIYLIAQAARAKGHHLLVRLTQVRAAKLLGGPLTAGDHAVNWRATGKNQRLPDDAAAALPGRLLVVQLHRPGFRPVQLCLFTTLLDPEEYPVADLVELYGWRWQVELNLRHVKTQLEAAKLEARSASMARKEWLATLVAYNLVRGAMVCAASYAQTPPLRLSFSACQRRLAGWLNTLGTTGGPALATWKKLLVRLGRCRLPKRRKPRPSEPRAQRHEGRTFPPLLGNRNEARKKLAKMNLES